MSAFRPVFTINPDRLKPVLLNPPVIIEAHASLASRLLSYNLRMLVARLFRMDFARRLSSGLLLAAMVFACSCKPTPKPDTEQADQMAMWLDSVPQLKSLNVSNAEIEELRKAHEAGLTDPSTVVMIKFARDRRVPFADGQTIADLLNAGSSEETVLELARLNQLGPWGGEARAMRLTGLSDKIILAVAQRRSQGLPVLTGEKLGEIKNTGASDATILEFVRSGITEQRANDYIKQHNGASGGHGFVYQGHSRKKS
jgi:hypothetical protein